MHVSSSNLHVSAALISKISWWAGWEDSSVGGVAAPGGRPGAGTAGGVGVVVI